MSYCDLVEFDPCQPYALLPQAAPAFISWVFAKDDREPEELENAIRLFGCDGIELDAKSGASDQSQQTGQLLAVVPVVGSLTPSARYGGTSLTQLARVIEQFDNHPNIGGILLQVTSPGGTVTGTPEAGDAVRAVRERGQTKIWAIADGLMASAATWIGTAADKVFVTPSGQVGSIGVISMYADYSKMYSELGIQVDVVRTPKLKARFTGVEPMTDDMRATMQLSVDKAYGQFKEAMGKNRKVKPDAVEEKFGGGEVLDASEAVQSGLVDGVATVDSVIRTMVAGLTRKRKAPGSVAAALQLAALE